ncbi:MAG: geranylgeranylglyceryl/heptaprenylglyceryl phosphate synthase [Bacteroidia bacterium]
MWSKKIKHLIERKRNRPRIAVLIDPDKFNKEVVILSDKSFVDFFFVGGSYLHHSDVHSAIRKIKQYTSKPVILFPGDEKQLSPLADGILFLSLVSGRNPEYLIEKQIKAAPFIQKHRIPFLPTAYILVNGNKISTTEKVTNTHSLPQNKDIIYKTALASAMIGMQAIYLEAGSGAKKIIRSDIVNYIKSHIDLPLIVGGGICSVQQIEQYIHTKADCLVIGNALEKNPLFLNDIKNYFQWK